MDGALEALLGDDGDGTEGAELELCEDDWQATRIKAPAHSARLRAVAVKFLLLCCACITLSLVSAALRKIHSTHEAQ